MKIYSSVQLAEVKNVADEAHRLGMTVTSHVPIGLNACRTIEAGQDQIDHIPYIVDIMQPQLAADAFSPRSRQGQRQSRFEFA